MMLLNSTKKEKQSLVSDDCEAQMPMEVVDEKDDDDKDMDESDSTKRSQILVCIMLCGIFYQYLINDYLFFRQIYPASQHIPTSDTIAKRILLDYDVDHLHSSCSTFSAFRTLSVCAGLVMLIFKCKIKRRLKRRHSYIILLNCMVSIFER